MLTVSEPHAPLRPAFPLRLPTVIQSLDRAHKRWIVLKVLHGRPRRPLTLTMKSATFLALLSTLLSANLVFGAKFPLSDAKKGTNIPVVQNQFIIEVDDLSDIPTKRSFPRVRFKISNLRKPVDLRILVFGRRLCCFTRACYWIFCKQGV